MDKKLRQVTDNIHDTIYLSSLESELIATPYFYRLHDIYQSSTAYMTFPTNRTKRYEHSVGTMELASEMLFSAVSNADNITRDALFIQLDQYFEKIIDLAIGKSGTQSVPYYTNLKNVIDDLFGLYPAGKAAMNNKINNEIVEAVSKGCFADSALDYFQYYPVEMNNQDSKKTIKKLFLYRCFLQAVRLVALFHDVGHPPYSHIMEDVLNELYQKSLTEEAEKWDEDKLIDFKECISPFLSQDMDMKYKSQTLYTKQALTSAQAHEHIGMGMLQSAINENVPNIVKKIVSHIEKSCKCASVLYYIMVVEFSVAIWTEKDNFFKAFHKIVDGIIDADRLDYIMRDSKNSGVDWGKIPYKRIINSAKLIYSENKSNSNEKIFVIAYPQKVADDLEDLLVTRYKIFARINFHHRCIKTSVALKTAVLELAENYLQNSDEANCINSDVSNLWQALGMRAGDNKTRVIRWNDSWLISMLHQALLNLSEKDVETSENSLKEDLEEILLNKKRYYSLLKRGKDNLSFVKKIFEYANITKLELEELRHIKEIDYYGVNKENRLKRGKYDVSNISVGEEIDRISELISVFDTGNLEVLSSFFPNDNSDITQSLSKVLDDLKVENVIESYKIIVNKDRGKTGIPKGKDVFDEIYLYHEKECIELDTSISLAPQINDIAKNIPWLYVYFAPDKTCTDINKLATRIHNAMAQKLSEELKVSFDKLLDERN